MCCSYQLQRVTYKGITRNGSLIVYICEQVVITAVPDTPYKLTLYCPFFCLQMSGTAPITVMHPVFAYPAPLYNSRDLLTLRVVYCLGDFRNSLHSTGN